MYAGYLGLGRRTRNARRLIQVLHVLVRHGFADLLRRAGFHRSLPARLLRRVKLLEAPAGEPATFGVRLRAALTELGPSFIKLGQVMSTRPDLFGYEMSAELSKLQDEVPPLPYEAIAPVIQEALDAPVDAIFASFEKLPVASASLSQVYRALLKTGEPVAVKVRRPGVMQIIDADIGLLRVVAAWLHEHVHDLDWLDAPGIVEEFARSVRRELDFELEAGIIAQFQRNFADYEDVFIPKVYPELCASAVLTMDWVDGVRIDRFDEYEARNCDRKRLAERGCEILYDMVFEHHLFHADPHPGNIFIMRDNRFALLDYGMAGHLEKADTAVLADLLLAVLRQDSAECLEALMLLTPGIEPKDPERLQHEIADFIAFEARAIIDRGQVALGLERATEILRTHRLQLAPRFSLLLKALATIEHVGRKANPDMNIVPILQPYVERLVAGRYRPVQLLKGLQQNASTVRRLTQQVPDDLSHLFRQLRHGHFRMQVQDPRMADLPRALERAGNRIAFGLLSGGLIIGSSLLVASPPPLAHIGIIGLVAAGLLGFALVLAALWSKKD
ncbi:MAG: hypothetical protein KA184_03595 [Candidatus Hydrogenedentes bacterium]|nr:hypothetical protein [Candidatus Hydrogenedentota bacterium]